MHVGRIGRLAILSTLVASALGPVANTPMVAAVSAIAAQTSAEEYYARGGDRLQTGDLQGAIEDYTQALRLDPNLAATYHNRGILRGRLGDTRGAREDLQRAAELSRAQGDLAHHDAALNAISQLPP